MAATTPEVRSSGRKRPQVKYYDSESGNSDEDDYEPGFTDDEDTHQAHKSLKTTSASVFTKQLPKKNIFPFEKLPAELKNDIYGLTLFSPDPIFLVSKMKAYRRTVRREIMTASNASGPDRRSRQHRRFGWRFPRPVSNPSSDLSSEPLTTLSPLIPGLLATSKAMYAETQPILYAANTFAVEDTIALHAFLAGIGTKNVGTLTGLIIKGWGNTQTSRGLNHPALTLLASATNLESLYIDCVIHYDGPIGTARQLFRDGHHWLETKGENAIQAVDLKQENFRVYQYGRNSHQKQKSKEENLEDMRTELRRLMKR